ncbi:hypothetical protein DLAC_03316 [Tieghemostelium lacteum]|uniref:Uncharacterized protein n=1 Tax=Tieghemostelium lacteum TaxID=361077 RepID=A0A152A1N1_TIELA|nr:hypothetical protein DLAC_03316 [Tieghemostelium lacteum]|eukprot:KYR00163.1 hypothetical protein DLAC_03316 [Tieghemostelium lacteum]
MSIPNYLIKEILEYHIQDIHLIKVAKPKMKIKILLYFITRYNLVSKSWNYTLKNLVNFGSVTVMKPNHVTLVERLLRMGIVHIQVDLRGRFGYYYNMTKIEKYIDSINCEIPTDSIKKKMMDCRKLILTNSQLVSFYSDQGYKKAIEIGDVSPDLEFISTIITESSQLSQLRLVPDSLDITLVKDLKNVEELSILKQWGNLKILNLIIPKVYFDSLSCVLENLSSLQSFTLQLSNCLMENFNYTMTFIESLSKLRKLECLVLNNATISYKKFRHLLASNKSLKELSIRTKFVNDSSEVVPYNNEMNEALTSLTLFHFTYDPEIIINFNIIGMCTKLKHLKVDELGAKDSERILENVSPSTKLELTYIFTPTLLNTLPDLGLNITYLHCLIDESLLCIVSKMKSLQILKCYFSHYRNGSKILEAFQHNRSLKSFSIYGHVYSPEIQRYLMDLFIYILSMPHLVDITWSVSTTFHSIRSFQKKLPLIKKIIIDHPSLRSLDLSPVSFSVNSIPDELSELIKNRFYYCK